MKDPTERQLEVLDFIIDYKTVNGGNSPSLREISEYFGWTKCASRDFLVALEKKGKITRIPGRSRSITVLTTTDKE